jgi:hypothetical protein
MSLNTNQNEIGTANCSMIDKPIIDLSHYKSIN